MFIHHFNIIIGYIQLHTAQRVVTLGNITHTVYCSRDTEYRTEGGLPDNDDDCGEIFYANNNCTICAYRIPGRRCRIAH